MGRRQYEDRYTAGPVRPAGTMTRSAAARATRPVSGPQYAAETRETRAPVLPPLQARASSPHLAYSGEHTHEHSAHGHVGGEPVYGLKAGNHLHAHSHSGDNNHDHHAPGAPGAGMPEVQMNSSDPVGDEISGIGLAEMITRFLEGQGVDVGQALRDAGYEREHQAQAATAAADRAVGIARSLRQAKRRLEFEQSGFTRSAPGFGIGKIGEAQQRVGQLNAALAECCRDNPEVMSEAKRRAAR